MATDTADRREALQHALRHLGRRAAHDRKQRQEFAEPSPGRQEMQPLRQEEKAQAVRHGESVAVARFEQHGKPGKHGDKPVAAEAGEQGGSGQSRGLQAQHLPKPRAEQHGGDCRRCFGKALRLGHGLRL
jgi:hypothetical protein